MVLPVPVPGTFVPGITNSAAFLNANVRDAVTFLLNPPICTAFQTVVQSIPNATFTALTFDANETDTYSGHSTVTNNTRYVAQVSGFYLASGLYTAALNGTGERRVQWAKNGSTFGASQASGPSSSVSSAGLIAPTRNIFLNAGEYLELQGWQNSGGALNTACAGSATSYMSVVWNHP